MDGIQSFDESMTWAAAVGVETTHQAPSVWRLPCPVDTTRDRAVHAFCRRLAASHTETWRHSLRVGRSVKRIMVALGADHAAVREAVQSAVLHDIGKLLLREVDIDKAGPFDADEYARVKEHPTLGQSLLAPFEALAPLLPAVLHHHERWDGLGYPYGLAGEAIPFLAQVVAVADTYDAMTSDRPYRMALSHDETVDELLLHSGTQFAPQIVEAFVCAKRRVRHA